MSGVAQADGGKRVRSSGSVSSSSRLSARIEPPAVCKVSVGADPCGNPACQSPRRASICRIRPPPARFLVSATECTRGGRCQLKPSHCSGRTCCGRNCRNSRCRKSAPRRSATGPAKSGPHVSTDSASRKPQPPPPLVRPSRRPAPDGHSASVPDSQSVTSPTLPQLLRNHLNAREETWPKASRSIIRTSRGRSAS